LTFGIGVGIGERIAGQVFDENRKFKITARGFFWLIFHCKYDTLASFSPW
jgi:hypothetical protein